MNLVQLQDDLRMLPLPALQAKAQGQDPNTPPWLAAAVLNERMTAQQKAGMAQGAAQGPQPSVIEQMQQKAGLMALQAQQQQAAQQQMMQQMAQAPQAVPQGVPQPEAQPQPQMMAGGGIARLSINPQMFNYRQGGVIGFADGGETGANLDAVKERAEQAIAKLRSYGLNQQKQDPQGYQQAQKEAAEAQQAVKDAMTTYQAELQQSGMNKPYFGSPKPTTAPLQGGKPMPESQGIGSIFVPGGQSGLRPAPTAASTVPAGGQVGRDAGNTQNVPIQMTPELEAVLRADAEKEGIGVPVFNIRGPKGATAALTPPEPQAAATAPQPAPQAGVASLPSGFEQSLSQGIERAKAEQGMTAEQAKARYEATMSDELRKPAGLEQLARLKQQQEQYAKSQEDRPYERLMKVLGAAGKGGMGGFGTGYLGAVESERAADAAQAAYQDKVMTAVEATRRGEATAKQKAMLDMIEKGDERKAKAISDQIQGASSGYSTAQAAKTSANRDVTERRGQDLQYQAAQLTARAADTRASRDEKMQTLRELSTIGRELTAEIGKIDPMISTPEEKRRRAALQQDLDKVREAIAKMGGNVTLSAGSAAPTIDPSRAAQFKVIR